MHKNFIFAFLILVMVIVFGCSQQEQKAICGGWDTFGEVICECTGKYEKPPCPSNAVCDAGKYFCDGICGECKCYKGPANKENEIPCEGREKYFKSP